MVAWAPGWRDGRLDESLPAFLFPPSSHPSSHPSFLREVWADIQWMGGWLGGCLVLTLTDQIDFQHPHFEPPDSYSNIINFNIFSALQRGGHFIQHLIHAYYEFAAQASRTRFVIRRICKQHLN